MITRIVLGLSAWLIMSSSALAADFKLASSDVKAGGTLGINQVFNGFGCSGKNISPELHWSKAPAGTQSFALTVYDPDAPTGSGWWHWVIYNLPATTSQLETGAGSSDGTRLPAGTEQGRTDFGAPGFGGACPPPGDKPHRYIFTLYALKIEKLEIPDGATAALIGYMINANQLEKASFTAYYGR